MLIACFEIANFRKLKSVRIDVSRQTTLLVGANNSGKTTAIEALQQFMVPNRPFRVTDLTLSDLAKVKAIGSQWEAENASANRPFDAKAVPGGDGLPDEWVEILPTLDVWIEAKEVELYRVRQLLPVLDDYAGAVGVRLRCEPNDLDQLRIAYLARRAAVANTVKDRKPGARPLRLWPTDLVDFLDRQMGATFVVRRYKLNPESLVPKLQLQSGFIGSGEPDNAAVALQVLPKNEEPLDSNPVSRLIEIDIVNAQRGLGSHDSGVGLSKQVSAYYSKHLDFDQKPEPADLAAIEATQRASDIFDDRLRAAFKLPLEEVARMGYPGGANPKVVIRSDLHLGDGLNHVSVLRYQVGDTPIDPESAPLELPEGTNGLGYQNLVLMIFGLMGFRDARRKVGKAGISVSSGDDSPEIKPLHLVLIEEPEAHLHAQVQQVFINHAYKTLTSGDPGLGLETQLIVSTHSSHIAHELDFASIRYFGRGSKDPAPTVPTTKVQNLSTVFGDKSATAKFVQRYLKVQHCNVFFADALVLMEGSAERILLPYFIDNAHTKLRESYVEYLDIGGAHAHRLRGLVDALGIPTLVITDLDAEGPSSSAKVRPELGQKHKSGNAAIKAWLGQGTDVDALVNLAPQAKCVGGVGGQGLVRFAYQTQIHATKDGSALGAAIPSTFEDALVLSNLDVLSTPVGTGLLRKFSQSVSETNAATLADDLAATLYENLRFEDKAKFAVDVLWEFGGEPTMSPPSYIAEGLAWLEGKVRDLQLMPGALREHARDDSIEDRHA